MRGRKDKELETLKLTVFLSFQESSLLKNLVGTFF